MIDNIYRDYKLTKIAQQRITLLAVRLENKDQTNYLMLTRLHEWEVNQILILGRLVKSEDVRIVSHEKKTIARPGSVLLQHK